MGRNRDSAKKAGTAFETLINAYLAEHVDDRIERRRPNGNHDRGDSSGVRLSPALGGGCVVLEQKDYGGKFLVSSWLAEADDERGNDDALASAVIAKRRMIGAPGRQLVLATVDDLVALLTGRRPEVR